MMGFVYYMFLSILPVALTGPFKPRIEVFEIWDALDQKESDMKETVNSKEELSTLYLSKLSGSRKEENVIKDVLRRVINGLKAAKEGKTRNIQVYAIDGHIGRDSEEKPNKDYRNVMRPLNVGNNDKVIYHIIPPRKDYQGPIPSVLRNIVEDRTAAPRVRYVYASESDSK